MSSKKFKLLKKFLIITMIIFLINIITSFVVTKIVYDNQFPRLDGKINSYAECKQRGIKFYSGDNQLQGYIFGDESNKGLVVISPGHNSGANSYSSHIKKFVNCGYQVFSYDATGTLNSEGDSAVGFSQAIIDLDSALTFIENKSGLKYTNLYLFGHSQGAYAACNMLELHQDINAVASISGVNTAMDAIMAPAESVIGDLAYTGYPFLYLYQCTLFGADRVNMSAVDAINQSNAGVIIIHGTNDGTFDYKTVSLTSHKHEITNTNVKYYTCSDKGANGHTSLLYESGEFQDYSDKQKNSTPKANDALMNEIITFFEKYE